MGADGGLDDDGRVGRPRRGLERGARGEEGGGGGRGSRSRASDGKRKGRRRHCRRCCWCCCCCWCCGCCCCCWRSGSRRRRRRRRGPRSCCGRRCRDDGRRRRGRWRLNSSQRDSSSSARRQRSRWHRSHHLLASLLDDDPPGHAQPALPARHELKLGRGGAQVGEADGRAQLGRRQDLPIDLEGAGRQGVGDGRGEGCRGRGDDRRERLHRRDAHDHAAPLCRDGEGRRHFDEEERRREKKSRCSMPSARSKVILWPRFSSSFPFPSLSLPLFRLFDLDDNDGPLENTRRAEDTKTQALVHSLRIKRTRTPGGRSPAARTRASCPSRRRRRAAARAVPPGTARRPPRPGPACAAP